MLKTAEKTKHTLYMPGSKAATKRGLFFRSLPEVKPGAEVIVPMKEKDYQPGEFIDIASAIASLAGGVIAILRN